MSLLFSKIQQFFSPENIGGSPTIPPPSPQSKEDIIDFLNTDDEEVKEDVLEIKPEKRAKAEEKEEDTTTEEKDEDEEEDDLDEIEKELEGPTEEQLELITPIRRKEILKEYPDLFKKFPYLERAYYREQAFTEILPTIEDAKVAVEKAETLDRFEGELLNGRTEKILDAVKKENIDGFYKIVDNYLPALARVDEQAYLHVIGNLTKHTISAMVQESRRTGNEVLQNAAAILNQFVFGSSDYKPPTNLSKEKPQEAEAETKINQREQEFMQRQFESVNGDLNTRVNNTLKNTIDAHIDPNKSMSDYVRRKASSDALEMLASLIEKDTRFNALKDKLWEASAKSNFSKDSQERIRSAFLSKAKTLLPSVIKKARREALQGTGHRVKNDEGEEPSKKGPVASGRPRSNSSSSSGKITKASEIPKGMRTLDFLMQD